MNLRGLNGAVGLGVILVVMYFLLTQSSGNDKAPTLIKNNGIMLSNNTISVAVWNLQIFGESKASNETLLNLYADKIKNYDIIFIQEIRDSSGASFGKLCAKLEGYVCMNSSRAGTTISKEQYGVLYKDSVRLISFRDYNPILSGNFERPPLQTEFLVGNTTFTFLLDHIKPDNVKSELSTLQRIADDSTSCKNIVVLGDFNADCSYYSPESEPEFDSWHAIILDNVDTTVSSTDCAYDRIYMRDDAFQYHSYTNIDTTITPDMSDHYLLSVGLRT